MSEIATPETAPIDQRMPSPVAVIPESLRALHALSKAAKAGGLPETTVYLVHLRASQINGCSFCAEMHSRELAEAGEPSERIWTVAAWREAPCFSEAERAALALTEAVTRIADSPDPVPDDLWDEVSRHYDEQSLASLILEIAQINVWNRLNVSVRQPAGAWG